MEVILGFVAVLLMVIMIALFIDKKINAKDHPGKLPRFFWLALMALVPVLMGFGYLFHVKSEISDSLAKAYYDCTRVKDLNIFYNEGIQDKVLMESIPTVQEWKQIAFEPRNVEVDKIGSKSAEISYDLFAIIDGKEKGVGKISMEIKRIGGEWKYDAHKFLGPISEKRDATPL